MQRNSLTLRQRREWSTSHRKTDSGASVKRGELYRVRKPGGDPKQHRVFVLVSRQVLIDSRFSTVICAPVFTNGQGLSTQVAVVPTRDSDTQAGSCVTIW